MDDLLTNLPGNSCNSCKKCSDLVLSRTKIVYPTKNYRAKLLVIGEAPGRDEDLQGVGFVGSSGKTLTKIFTKYGITQNEYSLANICWCRPENNRKPTPLEINNCLPNLVETIFELRPQIILTIGATPTKIFCGAGNLYDKIIERENNFGVSKYLDNAHPLIMDALAVVDYVIPAPHTSPLAFNRNAPNGEKWGIIFEQQVKKIATLFNSLKGI